MGLWDQTWEGRMGGEPNWPRPLSKDAEKMALELSSLPDILLISPISAHYLLGNK